MAAVAVLPAVGRARRRRHRRDRDAAGGDRREPLVRAAPRARGRPARRLVAAGQLIFLPLLAVAGRGLGWRCGLGVRRARRAVRGRAARDRVPARPARATRPAPYGATDETPPPRRRRRTRSGTRSTRARGLAQARLLAAGRRLLHLRRHHQRPDRHPPDRRPAPTTACRRCSAPACSPRSASSTSSAPPRSGWLTDRRDPRWLLFWYYGLRGLALLGLQRRAVRRRPRAGRVRRVLRPRLGGDRAAHRGAVPRGVRHRARRCRVRMGVQRPPDRRRRSPPGAPASAAAGSTRTCRPSCSPARSASPAPSSPCSSAGASSGASPPAL